MLVRKCKELLRTVISVEKVLCKRRGLVDAYFPLLALVTFPDFIIGDGLGRVRGVSPGMLHACDFFRIDANCHRLGIYVLDRLVCSSTVYEYLRDAFLLRSCQDSFSSSEVCCCCSTTCIPSSACCCYVLCVLLYCCCATAAVHHRTLATRPGTLPRTLSRGLLGWCVVRSLRLERLRRCAGPTKRNVPARECLHEPNSTPFAWG